MSLTEATEEEAARQVHATHELLVTEFDPEHARRSTRRRPSCIAFRDTSSVSKKTSLDQSQKLKGIQTMTDEEKLAADTMQELKASKKLSKSQAHAGGSSKGTGISPGVPDESTDILTTSSEGTGTKPGVPDEVNNASKAKADSAINWGSEEESEYSEEGIVNKEFVHGDEYVHDDVDEEMKDVEDTETGKDDDEITDAEKTEVTKGDREQSRKLPVTSSRLSVSSVLKMPPKRTTATTTPLTDAQIKALIAQGVADALAERDADRSRNGDDSHDSGSDGRRRMPVAREIKKLEIELWNLKVKGTDVASYTQRFQELAQMCERMFPEKSDEVEKYVGGLLDNIQGGS
ncbi:hypothetical protein Tco_0655243 [Tanacetum coccineum]|uniref:Reverse transcriptase domain-containing protein n=1 Tax=Tanacetum coccineum TaxID=301880 RepID=A0ABQ4X5K4_9ASTR